MTLTDWKQNKNIFIVASLLAHALFLSMMIFYFNTPASTIKTGNADHEILSSYVVDARQLDHSQPAVQQQVEVIKTIKNAIALSRQKQQPAQQHQQTTTRAALKGAPMPALTALLHAAIQREQRYPASAQEMEREGRVTLSFKLFADGSIAQPVIVRSSGTQSLDHAALEAVHHAAPFQHVDRYLKTAQDYQIDVVFQLS